MTPSLLFDRYVLKSLAVSTFFTAIVLAAIILLTQSLKFLELIIHAGASSGTFWLLTFLALPRLFEVVLPIALMISTIFIYNRMTADSEIVVMRAAGKSPMNLARPALILAMVVTLILLFFTTWLTPTSLFSMQKMRQVIKEQYSTLLFKEGIFNSIGKNLTVYIHNRTRDGELEGLLIHDSRPELPAPVTILAKRGVIVMSDAGQQVLVYDGSRQDFNEKTGALNRLDFERYSIDLPESAAVGQRWKEADERTFWELLYFDKANAIDREHENEFFIEAHRRVVGPFLSLAFVSIALCCLLLGPVNRRGQTKRIFLAVLLVIMLQGLYLSAFNIAAHGFLGLVIMYISVFVPLGGSLFFLSAFGETIRHKLMYRSKISASPSSESVI